MVERQPATDDFQRPSKAAVTTNLIKRISRVIVLIRAIPKEKKRLNISGIHLPITPVLLFYSMSGATKTPLRFALSGYMAGLKTRFPVKHIANPHSLRRGASQKELSNQETRRRSTSALRFVPILPYGNRTEAKLKCRNNYPQSG
ncbi:hypothetical protein WA026_008805 [Henosepilachna vigintioctopunctata]|uniref:Uncharacterized protein n=1 Tax=Henosepilachna vigintioctopunctata TaxID=420089 RepID=A0AAW1V996_9CUCU